MRGRTIALILLVVVIVIVGVAALVLMSGGDNPAETATPEGGVAEATLDEASVAATQAALSDQGGGDDGSSVQFTSDFVNICIALQDLPRGLRLTDQFLTGSSPAVGVRPWPVNDQFQVPQNAIVVEQDCSELKDKLVRSDIPRESPILSTQLLDDMQQLREQGKVGSDAALLLPPGQVAISLPMSPSGVGSVAYGMQHGDYVDVIFSFLFIEVDETFQSRQPNRISIITRDPESGDLRFSEPLEGRPEPSTLSSLGVLVVPQEQQRPRLVTQRTVSHAYVLHVGYFPPDGDIIGRMSPTPYVAPTADPNAEEGAPTPTFPPEAQPTAFLPVIVTLGVDPQDALVLTWALDSQIPISFALRSAIDAGTTPTTAVTLQYIIEQYSIPTPPLLPFALEPPIQSLRTVSLDVFRTFTFDAQGNPTVTGGGPTDTQPQ